MLNTLKRLDEKTNIQKVTVKKSNPKVGSFMLSNPIYFPINGIESLLFSELIIDNNGIIDAMEKNSKAPFRVKKMLRK